MKNKQNKKTVSKENAEIFEKVFGKDLKAKDVEYVAKKQNVIKQMLDGGSTPTGLKVVKSIFGYLQSFFTMFIPIGATTAICLTARDGELIPSLLKLLGISVACFSILKIAEFFVSAILIGIYSSILSKVSARTIAVQEKIKAHLKAKDAKHGVSPEAETNAPNQSQAMSPEDALNIIVDTFRKNQRPGSEYSGDSVIKNDDLQRLYSVAGTILHNMCNNQNVLDGIAEKDLDLGRMMYPTVLNLIDSTKWFSKQPV